MEERKSGIQSSIGRTNFTSGQRKVLTVEDESDFPNTQEPDITYANTKFSDDEDDLELVRRLEEARARRKESKNVVSEGFKNRVQLLTGISRLTKDVTIDGIIFSIKSLTGRETREIFESAAKYDLNISQLHELRAQTLARSIYKIDGQPINIILGTSDLENITGIIENFDESLINYLYGEYENLINENKKKFKSLSGDKEVVEDLKK